MIRLQGKSAIVTGSTRGIGLGIAQALAGAGINVLLNGFGDAAQVESIRADQAQGHWREGGPVSVAKFGLGESDAPELWEARALRQRQASDVLEQLLGQIG